MAALPRPVPRCIVVCEEVVPDAEKPRQLTLVRVVNYVNPVTGALSLKLRMIAVKKDGQPTQRVEVDFNGTVIDTVTVTPDAPQDFTVAVPADLAVAANGRVELELRFPDSVKIGAFDPDNRRRSIKLVSAALVPA